MEDRIREGKAAGLRNFPCRGWEENNAWLEAVLATADLVCWAAQIAEGFRRLRLTSPYRVLTITGRR